MRVCVGEGLRRTVAGRRDSSRSGSVKHWLELRLPCTSSPVARRFRIAGPAGAAGPGRCRKDMDRPTDSAPTASVPGRWARQRVAQPWPASLGAPVLRHPLSVCRAPPPESTREGQVKSGGGAQCIRANQWNTRVSMRWDRIILDNNKN